MAKFRRTNEPSPGFMPGGESPTALAERANRLRQSEAAAGRTLSQSDATRRVQSGEQSRPPDQRSLSDLASDAARYRAGETAAGRRVSISDATWHVLLNPNAGR